MQKGFKNLFGPFCPRILLLLPPRLFYHILCPYLRGQDLQEILSLLVRVTRFARNLVTFGPEKLQEMKGYKIPVVTNLVTFHFLSPFGPGDKICAQSCNLWSRKLQEMKGYKIGDNSGGAGAWMTTKRKSTKIGITDDAQAPQLRQNKWWYPL